MINWYSRYVLYQKKKDRAHRISVIRHNKLAKQIFDKIQSSFNPLELVNDTCRRNEYRYKNVIVGYNTWEDGKSFYMKLDDVKVPASDSFIEEIYDWFSIVWINQSVPAKVQTTLINL